MQRGATVQNFAVEEVPPDAQSMDSESLEEAYAISLSAKPCNGKELTSISL
jgi:hypothetical protein